MENSWAREYQHLSEGRGWGLFVNKKLSISLAVNWEFGWGKIGNQTTGKGGGFIWYEVGLGPKEFSHFQIKIDSKYCTYKNFFF